MLSLTCAALSIIRAVGLREARYRSGGRVRHAVGFDVAQTYQLCPFVEPEDVLAKYLEAPSKTCRAIRLLCVKSM
jgi:hypothetical protein